jgi:hypothetical protein
MTQPIRYRCQGTTRDGARCTNAASYCNRHGYRCARHRFTGDRVPIDLDRLEALAAGFDKLDRIEAKVDALLQRGADAR